jgi:hypothetical protein
VLGELRDGRIVEQLGEVDKPREIPVDAFVDLDQLERTRADLE